MTLTAYKAEGINRLGTRLLSTLKRCEPELNDSLRYQIVGMVKEALRKGLMGHPDIHPGVAKMARWGKCSERQARRNMRKIEALGIAAPIAFKEGGIRATRYWVDPEALIRKMMDLGANPSPDLMSEIRDFRADMTPDIRADMTPDIRADMTPDIRADITPGHLSGHVSAGIYNNTRFAKARRSDD